MGRLVKLEIVNLLGSLILIIVRYLFLVVLENNKNHAEKTHHFHEDASGSLVFLNPDVSFHPKTEI